MRRFKIGQEVICTYNGDWFWMSDKTIKLPFGIVITRRIKVFGPKKDEIVTVTGFDSDGNLYLAEYHPVVDGHRGAYVEHNFEPLLPTESIEELMEEIRLAKNETQKI